MKRVFAAVILGVTCIAASTSSFVRVGAGRGFAHSYSLRNPTARLGAPTPPMATFQNRIPAPLAAPAQAPTINGPCASGSCM
jgi:hypothetical protein